MKNFVSAQRVTFELRFWKNFFFLKTEIKESHQLQKNFSWGMYQKVQNISFKKFPYWGGEKTQWFLTAMFFNWKFFQSEKYQTALSKLCFFLLVHFSFFPLFGTSCNNQESRKSFFPKGLQTSLMYKLQACHETWTQGRFPGFSFQSDVARGSGSGLLYYWSRDGKSTCAEEKKMESVWPTVWKIQLQDSLSVPAPKPWTGVMLQFSPALAAELDCCGPP